MTVTHYVAEFTDSTGKRLVGEVFWDKRHQRRLHATICPLLSSSLADYPIWKTSGHYSAQNRAEMDAMVQKLKDAAAKRLLTLTSERLTDFAPP